MPFFFFLFFGNLPDPGSSSVHVVISGFGTANIREKLSHPFPASGRPAAGPSLPCSFTGKTPLSRSGDRGRVANVRDDESSEAAQKRNERSSCLCPPSTSPSLFRYDSAPIRSFMVSCGANARNVSAPSGGRDIIITVLVTVNRSRRPNDPCARILCFLDPKRIGRIPMIHRPHPPPPIPTHHSFSTRTRSSPSSVPFTSLQLDGDNGNEDGTDREGAANQFGIPCARRPTGTRRKHRFPMIPLALYILSPDDRISDTFLRRDGY